jgi:isopentenyl-diphosphate delta-isomerase
MNDETERVILVDADDHEIGTAPKLEAHQSGQLHRAFSVFIRNSSGEILLQRRADGKYHSSGLWTNTCCGHPRPGETTSNAAQRRLAEEMGIAPSLTESGHFLYQADLDRGLIEHEIDHVFTGVFNGSPVPDSREVSEWKWISVPALRDWVSRDPGAFTAWFSRALDKIPE